MQKVIILGTGAAAQLMSQVLKADSTIEVIGFSVHHQYYEKDMYMDKPVFVFENLKGEPLAQDCYLMNGLGYSNVNKNRERVFKEAKSVGFDFLTYLHPQASILSDKIGEGTFVMPGAVIEPFAQVGMNCVIWSNAVIVHHVSIEENCWVASGTVIAGESIIKRNTFIGVSASVANKVTVESFNIIGAQAFISKNTDENSVFLSRSAEKHRFDSVNYATLTKL